MRKNITVNQTKKLSFAQKICVGFLFLLMVTGGGLVLIIAIQGVGEAWESGSWPTVEGKIVRSEMAVDTEESRTGRKTSKSKSYAAKIEYEFTVNDETYRGSRIAAVQGMNAKLEHAQKILNTYPMDRTVRVSYKPDDPSVCVLEPGSWGGVGVLFGLAAVFTLVPLGMLLAIWRLSKNNTASGSTVITAHRAASTMMKFGITAFLLVFIGIGCVPLTWAIQGMREASASRAWPTVPGTITRSGVDVTTTRTRDRDRSNRLRTSRSYDAVIEYEFVVDDSVFLGSRVAVVSDQIGIAAIAKATCEKYPVDKAVTVSYNPSAPSECVLEPGRWGGIGYQLGFAGLFILLPSLFLKAIWLPQTNLDQYGESKEQRERFGLLFSERILEWEPGKLIHTHHDRKGFLRALVAGVFGGPIFGLIITLFPGGALLLAEDFLPRSITDHQFWFLVYFYAVVSVVSAIGISIWALIDGRVRDTRIDWSQGTFRNQVGWSVHEFPLNEITALTFRLPTPKPVFQGANASSEQSKKYDSQLYVNVGSRKFLLLKTEFESRARSTVRVKMSAVLNRLAESLNVPLQDDIGPP